MQLNNDTKIDIAAGELLKIMSSDGNNSLFGYILDPLQTKEPILVPVSKVEPMMAEFPLSQRRKY